MFLAQSPPPTYPKGPSSRIEKEMACFATQHAIFDQIVESWEQIPIERMVDYVEKFERNIIQECPYRLNENRQCHLFWRCILFSIRIHADYDLHDYCNMKT